MCLHLYLTLITVLLIMIINQVGVHRHQREGSACVIPSRECAWRRSPLLFHACVGFGRDCACSRQLGATDNKWRR